MRLFWLIGFSIFVVVTLLIAMVLMKWGRSRVDKMSEESDGHRERE